MNPVVIGFGGWRLLPGARELWRDRQQIALPPRALDCLVYLIEHRERAVGRDELISAVWGRADISDTLVAQTVLRIRRTLDEDGSGQEWIRTVPRFGYRWVAPTTIDDVSAADTGPDGIVPPQAKAGPAHANEQRRLRARWPLAAVVLTLVLAVALLWWLYGDRVEPARASVADTRNETWLVLPVVGEGHAAPEWIRLGAMDAIAEQLRRGGLPVLPSSQTLTLANEFAAPGQPPDIGNLRLASGSRHVVQPLSAQLDQRWRISLIVHDPEQPPVVYRGVDADLLAAARQAVHALLAGQGLFDHRVDDAGPRGELLAQAEAALLAGRLSDAEQVLTQAPPTLADDPLVQLKLAQVRYRLGDMEGALDLIDSVLVRPGIDDSTRALALIRGGNARIRADAADLAEQQFAKALALLVDDAKPELQGDAWNGLGVAQQMQGNVVAAGTSLARASALLQHSADPLAYARTLINLGLHAMDTGRPHEAIDQFLRAEPMVLRFGGADEQSALQQSIAWARLFLAQPAAARTQAERAVSLAAGSENPRVRRQALGLSIRVAVANGELTRAETLIHQYAEVAQGPVASPLLPLYRALLARARQDWVQTRFQALRALDTSALGERESRGLAAELALSAALALDDRPLATRALAVLAELPESEHDNRWRIRERLAQAQVIRAREGAEPVVDLLRGLWEDAGRTRLAPVDQLDVGLALLDALIGTARLNEAQRQLELLLPWIDADPRVALADAAIADGEGDLPRRQAALARARQLAGERVVPAETGAD